MEEYYFEAPISNNESLCIGTLSHREAEQLRDDQPLVDGYGYYLFVANTEPFQPPRVLAKLLDVDAANALAQVIRNRDILSRAA